MGYHYDESVRCCQRCGTETVHWRETSVGSERPRSALLRLVWLFERFACSWYCRRCTREMHPATASPIVSTA